jgi:hypothetical protein
MRYSASEKLEIIRFFKTLTGIKLAFDSDSALIGKLAHHPSRQSALQRRTTNPASDQS